MFGVKGWMERKRKNGASHLLATRGIAGFVVLACTVLIGLETSRVLERRADILADGRRNTANLAGSLIQHAELIFRSADAVLTGVVERLQHEKMDASSQERMRTWFERQLGRSPQFTSFAVIDSEGFQFVNTVGKAGLASVSDRDFFIYHRDHDDDALRIGSPLRGRFTGRWFIPVTRRFNKPDGS